MKGAVDVPFLFIYESYILQNKKLQKKQEKNWRDVFSVAVYSFTYIDVYVALFPLL